MKNKDMLVKLYKNYNLTPEDIFKSPLGFTTITRSGIDKIQGVERIDDPLSNLELFSILAVSEKRLLIDSCLQHAAAAFQLKSTVLWIGTSPKVFGYKLHNNIIAKEKKSANQQIGSYMFDYQFDNNIHECPYLSVDEMVNLNHIIRNI